MSGEAAGLPADLLAPRDDSDGGDESGGTPPLCDVRLLRGEAEAPHVSDGDDGAVASMPTMFDGGDAVALACARDARLRAAEQRDAGRDENPEALFACLVSPAKGRHYLLDLRDGFCSAGYLLSGSDNRLCWQKIVATFRKEPRKKRAVVAVSAVRAAPSGQRGAGRSARI